MRIQYNKLVRDRIPEIIRENHGSCETVSIENNDEYISALFEKLVEEALEALSARGDARHDAIVSELADVYEVLDAILVALQIDPDMLRTQQQEKRQNSGGFQERIFLLWSEN
ncbi:MAG: nucleoside triphosphate pyrophosphohydrolase [Chloroflexota bacterium]